MTISMDNLIEATGWSIIHSLWIGAAVYGLLLLLFGAFPEASARTRYAMSFSSLVVLFVAFIAVFMSKLDFSVGADHWGGTDFLLPMELAGWFGTTEDRSLSVFDYLVGGYLVGLCLQAALLGMGYFRLNRVRHVGLMTVPVAWEVVFARVLPKMGVTKRIGFWLSEQVSTPMVIGCLKPVILFPLAMSNCLTLAQVEAVLVHELSHIKRNDYLLNLLKTSIAAILFFNPFVWLLRRSIDQERENACDDMVLQQTGNPIGYAQALLQVAMVAEGGRHPLAIAATGKTASQLLQRIKRITNNHEQYQNVRQQVLVTLLAVLAAFSVAWVQSASSEQRPQNGIESPFRVQQSVTPKQGAEVVTVPPLIDTNEICAIQVDSIKRHVDTGRLEAQQQRVKTMADSLNRYFHSDTWKAQQQMIQAQSDSLQKIVASKEWQEAMENRQRTAKRLADSLAKVHEKNASEWQTKLKLHMDSLAPLLKGEAWEARQAEWQPKIDSLIKRNMAHLKLNQLLIDSLVKAKEFQLSDFSVQFRDLYDPELYRSPEYKALREKFEKDVEALRQKWNNK